MHIRVLREAGGIGDVIRVLPALRGLREKHPDAEIHAFIHRHYTAFVERSGLADRIIPTPPERRRSRLSAPDESKHAYLRTGIKYDLTVDLYCPAFNYEIRNPLKVWHDRIELFCKAAKARPSDMQPYVPIFGHEMDKAYKYLRSLGIRERWGYVAIQPFSTDPARDWPPEHWRKLAAMLREAGYGVLALDGCRGRTMKWPCAAVTCLPHLQLAATLKLCKLLICPDSGLAHLMGAVGGRALGLTASQSGAVLYRHYPKHTYMQPPDQGTPEKCQWPCYWRRPRGCRRQELRDAHQTCACLARLKPDTVFRRAEELLESVGMDRRLPRMPPPGPSAGLPLTSDMLNIAQQPFPVPFFDRTQDTVGMMTWPDTQPIGQWLWEAFRILKVGGKLHTPFLELPRRYGFKPIVAEGDWTQWVKPATWPHDFSKEVA